jgi:8-oxo-dGTP pyrophosphatase MutT (NUDIX family)
MPKKTRYPQSGVIAYRKKKKGYRVLLVTSRRRKRWVIPKGLIEAGMTASESAAKEAWEEAGIVGEVSGRPMGEYTYKKWGGVCHVQVFLFQVTDTLERWPEGEIRDRAWYSIEGAARRVDEPALKEMILALPDYVEAEAQT